MGKRKELIYTSWQIFSEEKRREVEERKVKGLGASIAKIQVVVAPRR
jgi:hypothetical protein